MRKINGVSLICALATSTGFAISPTPITGICCGVCVGMFIADTSWRLINNKNKK